MIVFIAGAFRQLFSTASFLHESSIEKKNYLSPHCILGNKTGTYFSLREKTHVKRSDRNELTESTYYEYNHIILKRI